MAFFSLAGQGGSLWASGTGGIRGIGVDGTPASRPEFKEIGGVYINFDSPRLGLVLTQVKRRSLGRTVPLLLLRSP